MKNGSSNLLALVAAGTMLSGAGSALAQGTYTNVNPPAPGELGHTAILQNIYGGSWLASGPLGMNRTNGVMTATRMADAGISSPVSLATGKPGESADAEFSGGPVVLTVRAKYAADSHMLGWIDDTAATPTFQPLMSSTDFDNPMEVTLSSSFRWALKDLTTGKMFTSRPADNAGVGAMAANRYDQLVTYHVDGKEGVLNEWVLFWEDRVGGEQADYDYNDAVMTVSIVPAPGPVALAAVGLAMLKRRRRR